MQDSIGHSPVSTVDGMHNAPHLHPTSARGNRRRQPRFGSRPDRPGTWPPPACAVIAMAVLGGAIAPAVGSAATPVTPRVVLESPRIATVSSAALPDGRVLVAWDSGLSTGDTLSAAVRPAGGVLPARPQVLRRNQTTEHLAFLPGGPADQPVLLSFQDTEQTTPHQILLDGDHFATQFAILRGGPSARGRFPSYARCPDGTTAFSYQLSYDTTPGTPATFDSQGFLADAGGRLAPGTLSATGPNKDYYQEPRITCDRTELPLLSVASDPDGQGTVSGERLRVVPLRGPATPLLERNLPPGASANSPEARVAPDGRVWILWTEPNAGSLVTYIATRDPGATGPVTTPAVLDASGKASTLFFGAGGSAHVLIRHTGAGGTLRYGIRTVVPGPTSDSFGPEEPLVPEGKHSVRLLTDHPDGRPRLLVVSRDADNVASFAVQGIPQAGSTEPLTSLGFQVDGSFTTSYLPSGDLFIAGREQLTPTQYELREGGLDTGAPPTLTNVTVPGTAVPGEPTALSIDARDPLGLSAFTWTVDGRTITDEDTTHTFAAPGTYVATAKAVDRTGATTELSRTIRVLDPAAVTPGTEAFREAVTGAGGAVAVDRAAPALSRASAVRGRKGKAASSVAVQVSPSEAVALDLELVGTLKRGGAKGQLVLKSTRVASAPAGTTAKASLKVPAALTRLVSGKLSVRITATDASGNRTQRTVAVTRAKR